MNRPAPITILLGVDAAFEAVVGFFLVMLSDVAADVSYGDPGPGVRVVRLIGIGFLLLVPLLVALAWRPIPSFVTVVAIGNGVGGILIAAWIVVIRPDIASELIGIALVVGAVLLALSILQWRARPAPSPP